MNAKAKTKVKAWPSRTKP